MIRIIIIILLLLLLLRIEYVRAAQQAGLDVDVVSPRLQQQQ